MGQDDGRGRAGEAARRGSLERMLVAYGVAGGLLLGVGEARGEIVYFDIDDVSLTLSEAATGVRLLLDLDGGAAARSDNPNPPAGLSPELAFSRWTQANGTPSAYSHTYRAKWRVGPASSGPERAARHFQRKNPSNLADVEKFYDNAHGFAAGELVKDRAPIPPIETPQLAFAYFSSATGFPPGAKPQPDLTPRLAAFSSSASSGSTTTNTQNSFPGDRFLGLRFEIGGQTHFGWAKVVIDSDGNNPIGRLTVTELAYDDAPDTPIEAGAVGTTGGTGGPGPTSTPAANLEVNGGGCVARPDGGEPGGLGLLALGAVGLAVWRRRKRRVSGA